MTYKTVLVGLAAFLVLCGLMAKIAPATGGTVQAHAAAVVSTPAQLAKADKCKSFLKHDKSGMWKHYESAGSTMQVEVGPSFNDAYFDTKVGLNGFMRCVATEGRMDNSIDFIDYIDARNHKSVATWSPDLGLRVE